jgi:hypothetical protein
MIIAGKMENFQAGCQSRDHNPREHISEQTEGKREDLGKFRDQLEQADQKVHRAEERHFEHPACVKELAEVTPPLRPETDHLDHYHRDQCQRSGKIQIYRNATERCKNIAASSREKIPTPANGIIDPFFTVVQNTNDPSWDQLTDLQTAHKT